MTQTNDASTVAPVRPLRLALFAAAVLALLGARDAGAQGYVAAEGGGSINGGTWAAEVFSWMLQKAGGAGNVAILGVSGADTQAAAKFQAAGAAAVLNLAILAGRVGGARLRGRRGAVQRQARRGAGDR